MAELPLSANEEAFLRALRRSQVRFMVVIPVLEDVLATAKARTDKPK